MSVEPIKRISVVEQAIEKIYDLILSQNLKEQDRLPPERQLSEMLGISRNSLREAIRVLDMLGILRVDQGSGMVLDATKISDTVTRHLTFAFLLNREKLNELFEARLFVESECAALAAERATDIEVQELEAAYADLVANRADRPRSIQCELKLHALVAKSAHNSVLEKILASLRQVLRESREATVPPTGVTAATVESQKQIIGAIGARNPAAARAFMSAHIASVANRMRYVVDELKLRELEPKGDEN